jgi:site-specific DNA-methyltransferase (adenine-specific)
MSTLPGFSAVQWDIRDGDCLKELPSVESGSVDIVVTSPPYNLEINYSTYRDDLPREQYLEWCNAWATEIARVLKENGSFFLNIGATPANPLLPHQLVLRLQTLFRLQNTIHWIKSITVSPKMARPCPPDISSRSIPSGI